MWVSVRVRFRVRPDGHHPAEHLEEGEGDARRGQRHRRDGDESAQPGVEHLVRVRVRVRVSITLTLILSLTLTQTLTQSRTLTLTLTLSTAVPRAPSAVAARSEGVPAAAQ